MVAYSLDLWAAIPIVFTALFDLLFFHDSVDLITVDDGNYPGTLWRTHSALAGK